MAKAHEQRAREIEAQMRGGVYPVQILAAALAEVERETAKKCAEIAEAAFPAGCKGWRTAHNGGKAAAAEIRRKFGLEEGAKER